MSRPWMPLYCETFLSNTTHLSAAETGAYMALIMHYWVNRSLPVSDRALARIARMTEEEWLQHRESIAFFFNDDWTHNRVEEELRKSDEAYEKRANAGKLGGTKPKKSKEKALLKPGLSNAPSIAEAKQNLILEQSSSNEEDIAWVSARARVSAAFARANSPNLPDTSRVDIWRLRGHDPNICVAVVSELVAKKPNISRLSYFDQAIADAHLQPKPQPRAGPQSSSNDARHRILEEIRAAKDGKRTLYDDQGRPPSEPDISSIEDLKRVS